MTGDERRARLKARLSRLRDWSRRRLPFGVRSLLGVVCVLGGIVGFLPVVGFWMIPLGLLLIGIDGAELSLRLRRARRGDRNTGKDGPG